MIYKYLDRQLLPIRGWGTDNLFRVCIHVGNISYNSIVHRCSIQALLNILESFVFILFVIVPDLKNQESPGTIAAIVIGAVVCVLLVIAIIMFWRKNTPQWRRSRLGQETAGFENQTYRSGSTRNDNEETRNAVNLRTLSESST